VTRLLGVGIVGVGFIGQDHLYALQTLAREGAIPIRIAALCDTDSTRLKDVAKEYRVDATFQDYHKLIADPAVDVVYVCTPTRWHPEVVKAAAATGKPLFCEKPLATDFATARRLCRELEGTGVPAQVGLLLHFWAHFLYLRRIHQKGEYGRLLGINFSDDQQFPVGDFYKSRWRADPAIAGSGVLLEHSIHDVDIIRWLYGDVERVYADITTVGDHAVEDQATVVLHLHSGPVCTLTTLWHEVWRPSERFVQVFYEHAYIAAQLGSFKEQLSIQVDDQPMRAVPEEDLTSVVLEDLALSGIATSKERERTLVRQGKAGIFPQAWRFIQNLQEGKPCSPSFSDAYRAHELVEAAYRSSRRRIPMRLPLSK
jgi:predicted dehydrogenase